jgi:hypothetical protein
MKLQKKYSDNSYHYTFLLFLVTKKQKYKQRTLCLLIKRPEFYILKYIVSQYYAIEVNLS